ncbi:MULTISPECIES: S1 family peptidase [Rhodococcus]|uniref:S1 family peptidase n=1 Tax=Rhodococcus TaxID=1827 RepID=UPI000A970CE8|nr:MULTISPECIES: serine protease [Rhodococcus]MBS3694237.1 trypsin-like peptidase domain-containing protein [Rhodococcus qingshengii]REK81497.1 serine protease [Rhodococcus erythropolis]
MSDSSRPIRDYVLPLVEVSKEGEIYSLKRFHGTCFLVGSDGIALTNAHLLGVDTGNHLAVLTADDDGWHVHRVSDQETHPSEDVAVLRIPSINYPSIMRISDTWEGSSFEYRQWSYPEETAQELEKDGVIALRPDLVYLQGYIRRRMQDIPLFAIRGHSFYELSEPGVSGCSGSPVISREPSEIWKVVGIFAGHRHSAQNGNASSVGYAVRADAIHNWSPSLLGRCISEL